MQRLLIIEDETTAYEKLITVVGQLLGIDFEHDWAKSVKQTRQLIKQKVDYDLVIADIQLSDGLSLSAFEDQDLTCPIIFCSAYNDYLLEAFQTNGIAYILKPYEKEDLQAAFDKYDKLFPPDKQVLTSLKRVFQQPNRFKERLVIKTPKGIQLLFTKDISLIEARGDFCRLYRPDGKVFSQGKSLSSLMEMLDPRYFFRVNRSQIVRLDHLLDIEPYFKNRLALRVKGYPETVTTSSTHTKAFREWLEG